MPADNMPTTDDPKLATPDDKAKRTADALPLPSTESQINLASALAMAGADNPTIALAEEAVRASLADQMQARALLFPTINSGFNFRLHDGNLLTSSGIMRDVNSESLYAGLGASARGTSTVAIPGVNIFAHLADAAFEPRLARLRVQSRSLDSTAIRNQILLAAIERYFDLANAEARLQAVHQSESELAEVVRVTEKFAKAGQGREPDALRALSESLLLHTEAQQIEEEASVASTELARLLASDPVTRLRADPEALSMISLVQESEPLDHLIQIALSSRPEVGAQATNIREAETRLRQERVRPLLPVISVGFSVGSFGGGSDLVGYRFDHFGGRMDFDAVAIWSLQNLGFGNKAVQNRVRSELNQSIAEQARIVDDIRNQVAAAHAQIAERQREVEVARRRLQSSQNGFRAELIRTKNLEGKPIEVLNSLNQLAAARQAFIQAVIGFNQAQFRLFVAIGQPPGAISP